MTKSIPATFVALLVFCLLTAVSVRSFAQDVVWSADGAATGALQLSDGTNAWNWTATDGAGAASALPRSVSISGLHEHFTTYTAPLAVATGDVLFTEITLDAAYPGSELMLSWNANGW